MCVGFVCVRNDGAAVVLLLLAVLFIWVSTPAIGPPSGVEKCDHDDAYIATGMCSPLAYAANVTNATTNYCISHYEPWNCGDMCR